MKKEGIKVVGLEVTDVSKPFDQIRYPNPVCLVVGNEALGVSREVLELADEIVEIPMFGFKNSVNVAVAFGIVVFEVLRQHRDPGSLILDPG
jgi:tRNA G18 (ribose-2'-O)-methylase SpoU